jgi:hypothetical protein
MSVSDLFSDVTTDEQALEPLTAAKRTRLAELEAIIERELPAARAWAKEQGISDDDFVAAAIAAAEVDA